MSVRPPAVAVRGMTPPRAKRGARSRTDAPRRKEVAANPRMDASRRPLPASHSPKFATKVDPKASIKPEPTAARTAPADNDPEPPAEAKLPVWLDVEVNGQLPGIALLLKDADGMLWARAEDFATWRLPLPQATPYIDKREAYYPISRLPGVTVVMDEATQSISIRAPARLFPETLVNDHVSIAAKPDRSQPGGFFNYDVVAAHSFGDAVAVPTTVSGTFEIGAFNRWGELTTSAVRSSQTAASNLVRLDTTFTQDRPDVLASLRIGDSISGTSSWGGAVHFAGVQWSTDFTTQPGFVTTPLAGIRGEAVLPSTLDLYINEALRLQTTLPPGPFAINDLPVNSGEGEARVIVRNMLGQQETISVPYFVSPSLLRAGLSSFSYEIGAARYDYALASNDYGRALAVATDRYGFTDSFTGEVHTELLEAQQTGGLGGVWLVRGLGVLNAAAAASHSVHGDGELGQIGFERQWHMFSVGVSVQYSGSRFVDLGMLPTDLPPVRVLQADFSVPMPRRGSLSVNYAQEDYRTTAPVHLLSTQASWPVGRHGFLGLTALKPLRGGNGATIAMNFTLALGSRTSVSTGVTRQDGHDELQLQAQQNLPAGTGTGYRVTTGAGASDQLDAIWQYQNDVGTYTLQGVREGGQSSGTVEAQGGVALLNDHFYLSRKLDESFAVVQVGDFAHVHVYADNQEVAETDNSGTALVPRIRAYEHNLLRIEQADLPLDVDIDTVEADAVPYRRSGVRVDFDLHRSLGALVTLVQEDGTPIPVGSVAVLTGNATEFPVGMHGETYLTGLSKTSVVRVSWPGKTCTARVAFVPSTDPVPKLGPIVCEQATP